MPGNNRIEPMRPGRGRQRLEPDENTAAGAGRWYWKAASGAYRRLRVEAPTPEVPISIALVVGQPFRDGFAYALVLHAAPSAGGGWRSFGDGWDGATLRAYGRDAIKVMVATLKEQALGNNSAIIRVLSARGAYSNERVLRPAPACPYDLVLAARRRFPRGSRPRRAGADGAA